MMTPSEMKQSMAIALFLVTLVCAHAKAEVATQCSIDHAVSGAIEFQQCPTSATNDAILTQFDGVRLDTNNSDTPIWVHGICRYVDNTHATDALFIPLKSAEEWKAFYTTPPAHVHLAGCCLPRAMRVDDVPFPPAQCETGWNLKGIVDIHKQLVALASGDEFTLAPGLTEDSSYPILNLPVSRDDRSARLPDSTDPTKAYTAFYRCGDTLDYYIDFHMQCKNTQWIADDIASSSDTPEPSYGRQTTDVTPANTQPDATCQISQVRTFSKRCDDGGAGSTSYRQVYNSCTKLLEIQIVGTTCGGISGGISGCVASSHTNTVSCPSGQVGSMTTRTDHLCDGSHNGDGSDTTTVVSNTCSTPSSGGGEASCVPIDALTTTPCPDPTAGGIITLRRVRVCDGSHNGAGTTTETVYANNCQPSGCIESAILTTSQVCQGGTIVSRKVFNSCTKQISTVVVSNTCH